jgi:hypothetical protein
LQAFVDLCVGVVFTCFNKLACAIARASIAIGARIAFCLACTSIVGGGCVAQAKEKATDKDNQNKTASAHHNYSAK